MTVAELIDCILRAYPGVSPEAIATFKPVYFARFGRREGPHLQAAFEATLAEFKPTLRQPFPVPADFERHMPSIKIDDGKDKGGKPIDLAGRKRRADSLFANWRAGQGARASRGNPALMKALENIARHSADILGWQENPEPLVLTRDQLKVAAQRAISFERLLRYGQPPKDCRIWWGQIHAIASEWGLQVTPEWWDDETAKTLANPEGHASRVERVRALVASTAIKPPEPSPEMKASLMRSAIKFHRDMGFVDVAEAKERELAALEAQLAGEAA